MPAISCAISSTQNRASDRFDSQKNHKASAAAQMLLQEHKDEKLISKESAKDSTVSQGKPIPTHLLILKAEDGMGLTTKTAKVAAAASQTSNPSFELQSIGVRTMKSTENAGTNFSPDGRDSTLDGGMFSEQDLTNMALHR